MGSSIQPRKQRKMRYTAHSAKRKHFMRMHVSKELREKLEGKPRTVLVRKGDRVRVIAGSRKGHAGRVMEVDYASLCVYIEGVSSKTAKGVEKPAPISVSNVEITEGDFSKGRLGKRQQ